MTVKNTPSLQTLRNKFKKFSEIEDVLLFGSFIRGKISPNDVDVLLIFKEVVDKHVEQEIKRELSFIYSSVSIVSKTKKTSLDPAFDARESILFEGKSLLAKRTLAEAYGFSSFGMFRYDIHSWTHLQKTKFYYALNGRSGRQGILNILHAIKLSDTIILTPLDKIEPMKDFLDSWKISYQYFPTLLPQRMSSERILKM